MADELTALDLFGLPKEEAASKSRARLAALRGGQNYALLGALSGYAPLEGAAKMLNENAGAERDDVQKNASTVLQQTLGLKQHEAENVLRKEEIGVRSKEAEMRLAELQQQIAYQNAQLRLMGAQFGHQVSQDDFANAVRGYEEYLKGVKTPSPGMVENKAKTQGEVEHAKAVTDKAAEALGPFGGLARTVGGVLTAGKEAQLKALEEGEKAGGYRQEQPLSFEEWVVRSHGQKPGPVGTPSDIVQMKTPKGDVVPVPRKHLKDAIRAGGVVVGG